MELSRKARVAAAVKAIRTFHACGRRVSPRQARKDAYGRQAVDAAAKALGLNPAPVRARLKMANEALAHLHAAVTTELKACKPGRSVRHRFRTAVADS